MQYRGDHVNFRHINKIAHTHTTYVQLNTVCMGYYRYCNSGTTVLARIVYVLLVFYLDKNRQYFVNYFGYLCTPRMAFNRIPFLPCPFFLPFFLTVVGLRKIGRGKQRYRCLPQYLIQSARLSFGSSPLEAKKERVAR